MESPAPHSGQPGELIPNPYQITLRNEANCRQSPTPKQQARPAAERWTRPGLSPNFNRFGVLGVTAGGDDLAAAIQNAYTAVEKVNFKGLHHRTDIGQKGLKRR